MSGRGARGGRGGRGGGGGFGGGRGGRRAVAANSVPWQMDPTIALDGKPSELFPPYKAIPKAPLLLKKDDRQVSFFLSFREQGHDSPLYTQSRTWATTELTSTSSSLFGSSAKATIDIFEDGVPSYSHKFQQKERTLPDLASRPFAKEFFPGELHSTLDGLDGPSAKRRKITPGTTTQAKTIALSSAEYKSAEDIFGLNPSSAVSAAATQEGEPNYKRALQLLEMVEKKAEDGEDAGILTDDDEDDWVKNNEDEDGNPVAEEDDDFEEDSGDDYNAEQYFDGNQDDDEYDEGGDDGGDYY
ncbi:DNA-directed RNA polymerase III, subunit Rpc31 [Neurospora tetraspora]|uniref:DNA-directed RNA polymerase III subunit n=1 Tax=Neurospora tetraspora TaxID=94610 RepID=A0AAE0MP04_9PEZI|nr:DNA-directed RNA polymerase III, subunit Rpc31 [Neurospora tetraspora]